MAQINLTHLQDFLVGILGIANLINKPRITQSIGVLDGHCLATLQWEHKVAGVEHIDNRTDAVALNLSHVATSLGHGIHQALHLGRDVLLYHLLIAAQLSGMVTTNALMVVRRLVLVKGV